MCFGYWEIRFEDDKETFDCLLSLNMKTGDVKLLRDEQDTYYYEVLVTKQGIVLLEIAKDTDKTIIKTINPETLETISVLDEVNESMTFPFMAKRVIRYIGMFQVQVIMLANTISIQNK